MAVFRSIVLFYFTISQLWKQALFAVCCENYFSVILPWIDAILLRRNDRIVTQLLGYSAHFVSLIRAIHEKRLSNTAGRGEE